MMQEAPFIGATLLYLNGNLIEDPSACHLEKNFGEGVSRR
jgi:hypothetical protein